MNYIQGSALTGARAAVRLSVQGLSIVKPPYGGISAISFDRGEVLWRIAQSPD